MPIGCISSMYKHWSGLFYPDRLAVKLSSAFNAEEFKTVEIEIDAQAHVTHDEQTPPVMLHRAGVQRMRSATSLEIIP